MLWPKIGRSVLGEVDNSRLLLWFVGGEVHKVICGNCWHLLIQEQMSYKYQRNTSFTKIENSLYLPEIGQNTGPLWTSGHPHHQPP